MHRFLPFYPTHFYWTNQSRICLQKSIKPSQCLVKDRDYFIYFRSVGKVVIHNIYDHYSWYHYRYYNIKCDLVMQSYLLSKVHNAKIDLVLKFFLTNQTWYRWFWIVVCCCSLSHIGRLPHSRRRLYRGQGFWALPYALLFHIISKLCIGELLYTLLCFYVIFRAFHLKLPVTYTVVLSLQAFGFGSSGTLTLC